jgi:hypothetical protein
MQFLDRFIKGQDDRMYGGASPSAAAGWWPGAMRPTLRWGAPDGARLNPDGAESLQGGNSRRQSYVEMVEHILTHVRSGYNTCVACYGHPGVFANPTHEAVRRAKDEGFSAKMLPGISAEDCLLRMWQSIPASMVASPTRPPTS